MQQYKREAGILLQYMRDTYKIEYKTDSNGLFEIPLKDRWLKGEEYAFLIRHYKTYHKIAGFTVNQKSQDPIVYEFPQSNLF